MKVAVSILKSLYDEKKTIELINETSADYIHIDVMDGLFVQNKTPKYSFLESSNKKLNVHIMAVNPEDYVSTFLNSNVDIITVPVEININFNEFFKIVKSHGIKVGLAINPETKIEKILPYIKELDQILIMSVNPGMGGQKFMNKSVIKVNKLSKLRKENGYSYELIVDGGINDQTIHKVSNADIVVSGSFVCMSADYVGNVNKLKL